MASGGTQEKNVLQLKKFPNENDTLDKPWCVEIQEYIWWEVRWNRGGKEGKGGLGGKICVAAREPGFRNREKKSLKLKEKGRQVCEAWKMAPAQEVFPQRHCGWMEMPVLWFGEDVASPSKAHLWRHWYPVCCSGMGFWEMWADSWVHSLDQWINPPMYPHWMDH